MNYKEADEKLKELRRGLEQLELFPAQLDADVERIADILAGADFERCLDWFTRMYLEEPDEPKQISSEGQPAGYCCFTSWFWDSVLRN